MRFDLKRKALGALWVGLAMMSSMGAKPANAAPSLILLEDSGDSSPVYRQVIESLGAVIVANNLGRYYDHIDVLTGTLATRDALFSQIRKRGAKSAVDLVLLTHGSDKVLSLTSGNITDRDIRSAGALPGLRLVYMMACYSASLDAAWRATGAQIVVGHQDINSMPGFFFPRFLSDWAQGSSARDAAEDAYQFSQKTASMLAAYVKDDDDYLSSVGITRSEPVLQGVDIDRTGHSYPDHVLTLAPLEGVQSSSVSSDAAGGVSYAHSDFERTGISLLGAMVPQESLNVDAIPSAQMFVDRVGDSAWAQLRDSFPGSSDDVLPGLDLPTDPGQQIWIDGDAIRYFLASVRDYAGDKLGPVMDKAQGIRLTRQGDDLLVAIYFDGEFDIGLQDESKIPNWQPYSVHVPKTIRFSVAMQDGVLSLTGLDQGSDALNLKVKMPALPDSVWVRSASVDLSNGNAHVEAGVIGDAITIVANGEILARKFDGVDIWASIESNLPLLTMPTFTFH